MRDEGRLPLSPIQWDLATYHQCPVSEGASVGALPRVGQQAQPRVAAGQGRLRASPFAQADEPGGRETGRHGYVWTVSPPTEPVFGRRRRTKAGGDEMLGDPVRGGWGSDCSAA